MSSLLQVSSTLQLLTHTETSRIRHLSMVSCSFLLLDPLGLLDFFMDLF